MSQFNTTNSPPALAGEQADDGVKHVPPGAGHVRVGRLDFAAQHAVQLSAHLKQQVHRMPRHAAHTHVSANATTHPNMTLT